MGKIPPTYGSGGIHGPGFCQGNSCILFHIKQGAIFNCNYAEYKHANDHSTDEIAGNYSEMLVETFPELGLKKNKETDTVH